VPSPDPGAAAAAIGRVRPAERFPPGVAMALIISNQNGDWNTGSTWIGGNVPVSGTDTVQIKHAVTVAANTSVGTSPATGGTPAVQFEAANASLAINGGTFTCLGDIYFHFASSMMLAAGTSFVIKPAAGQTYKINSVTNAWTITCNGTSGSHCTFKTDLSNGGGAGNAYVVQASGVNMGFLSCSYTDFTNIGSSSQWGVIGVADTASANTAISITNCTFTGCNAQFRMGQGNAWDGNFTFTGNTFSSSVTNSGTGTAGCLFLNSHNAKTSGTRLFNLNSLDKSLVGSSVSSVTFNDNYFGDGYYYLSSMTWNADTDFARNFINITQGSGANTTWYNSARDCYIGQHGTANPHYTNIPPGAPSGSTFTGMLFEAVGASNDGTGDCFLIGNPTSSGTSWTIQKCILIPTLSSNNNAGTLFTLFGTAVNVLLTAEHNTYYAGSGQPGAAVGETDAGSGGVAGYLASLRANICWDATRATQSFYVIYDGSASGGGTTDQVSPTLADYNCPYNLQTAIPAPTYNFTNSGRGYGLHESAVPGAHDLADQDPLFVDRTRNLANWGGTTAGGGTATVAGALATLASNPSLIGQANTGLLAWVRAGFVPTNQNLANATYPGDAATTDAAGNPLGGTIGAMAALTYQPWIFGDQIESNAIG
jgi:hypothetical protein